MHDRTKLYWVAKPKRVLKNETINVYHVERQQQEKEMTFSNSTPKEEN